MDIKLQKIINDAQSSQPQKFEPALTDLRFLIERFVQNRYTENDKSPFAVIYYDKNLIDYKLDPESLLIVKWFLFFLLLNFPDRAAFAASCLKAFLDKSIRKAICAAIRIYMTTHDDATAELMFAISDVGDMENYFSDKEIYALFQEIATNGKSHSKEIAKSQFDFYRENYQK